MEGIFGSPADRARPARNSRNPAPSAVGCGLTDVAPMMPQMPEGCAGMIMATSTTGALPSPEQMCPCIAAVDVSDMPNCMFGPFTFDAATHASCVEMVAGGSGAGSGTGTGTGSGTSTGTGTGTGCTGYGDCPDTYCLYLDGETPTCFPRVNVTGPVVQQLFQFKGASSQRCVRVNETHMFIPFRAPLQAEFAQHNHVSGEYEAGVANVLQTYTTLTMAGRNAQVMASEKLHVLDYAGLWDGTSYPQPPTRDARVEAAAKENVQTRNALVFAQLAANRLGTEIFRAATDANHFEMMLDYADATPDGTQAHRTSIARLRTRIAASDVAGRRNVNGAVKRVANGCQHLEQSNGMAVLNDMSGFLVPLGQPIVSHTASSVRKPQHHFDINSGVTIYMHDRDTDLLERFTLMSSMLHTSTPDLAAGGYFTSPDGQPFRALYAPGLYVGPVDGRDWPVASGGGRPPQTPPMISAKLLNGMVAAIPIDHTFYSTDDDASCPYTIRISLAAAMSQFDMAPLIFPGANVTADELEARVSTELVPLFTQTLNCGLAFGRDPDATHGSQGFDMLAAMVWSHALIEIPPEDRAALLLSVYLLSFAYHGMDPKVSGR